VFIRELVVNETSHTAPAPDDETLPAGRPRTTSDLAVAKLRTALQERSGYVVVTAESAAVAEALFTAVEPRLTTFRTVRASGRTLDPEAIVRALWREGEPPFPARLAMRTLLDEARAAGQPIVVAVTDAELADSAKLERVRLTLEAAPDAGEIVRIALLGGPPLIELLRRPESRAVALRIGATVQVPSVAADIQAPAVAPAPASGGIGRYLVGALVVAGLAGLAVWMGQPPSPTPPVEVARTTPPPAPAAVVPPTPPPAPVAVTHEEPTPAPPVAITHEPAPPVPPPTVPTQAAAVAPSPHAGLVENPTPVAVVDAQAVAKEPEPTEPEPAAPPEPAPTPAPPTPEAYAVPADGDDAGATAPKRGETALQVGAFVKPEGAQALRTKLAAQFPRVYVSSAARGGTTFHRVRVGGFRSAHDVTVAETWLKAAGYPATRVRE
jgi:cell division protein FtsN